MLPDPLHPAVVHFPVVLAILLPIFALGALWAIRRGAAPRRAWAIPVGVAIALAISSWVAVQTGEAQDERVERVVAEQPLETHEERAETFLALTGAMAALALIGLVGGRVGGLARVVGTAGAAALVVAAASVGHSGGELVYKYGAASAYTNAPASSRTAAVTATGDENAARPRREREDHE